VKASTAESKALLSYGDKTRALTKRSATFQNCFGVTGLGLELELGLGKYPSERGDWAVTLTLILTITQKLTLHEITYT
jgi:hypothetical protein